MPGNGPIDVQPLQQAPALRQQVHGRLESMIIEGILQPGDRLVETDLADSLGVSRGPIREALQLLERDGWVDLRPRQGAFVHQPTEKEIDDFFGLRRVLEVESARLATRTATPDQRRSLRALVDEGLALLARDTDPFQAMEPGAFHHAVAEIAGNQDLADTLARLSRRGRWYVARLKVSRREDEWGEHAGIVDAILAGDEDAAGTLMAAHIDRSRDAFKRLAEGAETS